MPSKGYRKKAAVYVRYSSENQRDGYSVEYQLDECKAYIEKEGLEFAASYVDEAVSGRSAEKREAFFRLLSDVKAGLFDFVVVYKYSRFARNLMEATLYRQQIEKHGAKLLSAMERIDDSTPEGRMMRNIIMSMDEYYSDNLSTFVQSSMHVAAKSGRYLGGEPPFGYRIEDGSFAIHEPEAEAVRRAFALRAAGLLPADILRDFAQNGIRGRNGKPFTQQLLNKIFRAEKYRGVYEYKVKGYEPVRIEGGMPRIVTDEEWDAVQRAVDQNSKARLAKPRTRKNVYPLTGIIRCAECGEPFTGHTKGNGLFYYACRGQSKLAKCSNGAIKRDELERYVFGKIGELILAEGLIPSLADAVMGALGESPDEGESKLAELRKEKAEIERKLDVLLELAIDGKMPREVMERKAESLSIGLEAVKAAIRSAELKASQSFTRESVEAYLRRSAEALWESDDASKKALAEQFVESITVSKADVNVRLAVSAGPTGPKVNNGWPSLSLSPKRKKNRSGWSAIGE